MFHPNPQLIRQHLKWLHRYPVQHERNWGQLYNSNEEAAVCEAAFWSVLTQYGVHVEPNPNLLTEPNERNPDFRCNKDGREFYVEVTCIQIDTVARKTSLQHCETQSSNYADLNEAIFQECRSKTKQCASVNAPCLVAIGTFHYEASVLCVAKHHLENLFTSPPQLAIDIDTSIGRAFGEPYGITDLSKAVFHKPDEQGNVAYARTPVSGLLVGGFGCSPISLYGLVHPDAKFPFDSTLLPRLEFCQLEPGYESGSFEVTWSNREAL